MIVKTLPLEGEMEATPAPVMVCEIGTVTVLTAVPCVIEITFTVLFNTGFGTLSVKLLPETELLKTPWVTMFAFDEAGTVAVLTNVPCVIVMVFTLALIFVLGT